MHLHLTFFFLSSSLVTSAVIITHLCTASTFFTLLSWLPTFFKDTFPEAKVTGLPVLPVLSPSAIHRRVFWQLNHSERPKMCACAWFKASHWRTGMWSSAGESSEPFACIWTNATITWGRRGLCCIPACQGDAWFKVRRSSVWNYDPDECLPPSLLFVSVRHT